MKSSLRIKFKEQTDPGTVNKNTHIWVWAFITADTFSLCSILWTVECFDYFLRGFFGLVSVWFYFGELIIGILIKQV